MEIKGAAQLYLKRGYAPPPKTKKNLYFYKRIKTTKLIVFYFNRYLVWTRCSYYISLQRFGQLRRAISITFCIGSSQTMRKRLRPARVQLMSVWISSVALLSRSHKNKNLWGRHQVTWASTVPVKHTLYRRRRGTPASILTYGKMRWSWGTPCCFFSW